MKTVFPIALSLLLASAAIACNIPVFRYALERWQPDRGEVLIFSAGVLSAADAALAEQLAAETADRGGHANANVERVDLSDPAAPNRAVWDAISASGDATLPHVVVRTPIAGGRMVNAWHGPLQTTTQVGILQSPARQELARRLLAGDSIVWLMIGSNDESRNASARQMLTENFDLLAAKIVLPEGIGLPGSELYSEIPLVVRYSLLEIDRADSREQLLVRQLSGLQSAAFAEGQPLIVPVFGRGRALEVIPADDFDPRLMQDLALFLSGACSCQVKERNPGFDLLLSADWKTQLFGDAEQPPPAQTGQNRPAPILLNIPPGN